MRSRPGSLTCRRSQLARFLGALVLAVAMLAGTVALAATGALVSKGCVADPLDNPAACRETAQGLESISSIAISADGRSLYAAGANQEGAGVIGAFTRNPASGALSVKGCIAASPPSKTPNAARGPCGS